MAKDGSVELIVPEDISQWHNPKEKSATVKTTEAYNHSGKSSFVLEGKYGDGFSSKEYFLIDLNKTYTLSAWMRSEDGALPASGCLGLTMYNESKKKIAILHVSAFTGTEAPLLDAVKAGDNTFYVKKNEKCLSIVTKAMVFNAKDDLSDLPNFETTSRLKEFVDEGDKCKVVLYTPLSKAYPAGTMTRMHTPWGADLYWLTEGWVKPEWTYYEFTFKGEAKSQSPKDQFWAGTKYVRVFARFGNWNHKPKKGAKLLLDDIRFSAQ